MNSAALSVNDQAIIDQIRSTAALTVTGKVSAITGPVIRIKGINASVGQQIDLWPTPDGAPVLAQAISVDEQETRCMAIDATEGLRVGTPATTRGTDPLAKVGDQLLGRIVDPEGRPLDGKPLAGLNARQSLTGIPPSPLTRKRITQILETGVRSLDTILTMGHGQRVGIYAGAGVGKTTLLSMLAMHGSFDICVIGLIGERGREVREFIEDAVTEQNRPRTCVVAVTGDAAPLSRVRGAKYATAIAEYFRDKGKNVVLMIDSLTRYGMALREVGLAAGELPATKGYPPSVFVELAKLLERAGNSATGSITGIYTVLVEGDDMNDPIADSTRALLDGHIVLSRDLANRGVFPAVDVLASRSRLITQLATPEKLALARQATAMLADYEQSADLIKIGAYQRGSDPATDLAIRFHPEYLKFITQPQTQRSSYEESTRALDQLIGSIGKNRKGQR